MGFSELVLNTEYRSSIALTSRDFYAPILKVATKYDRAVGLLFLIFASTYCRRIIAVRK